MRVWAEVFRSCFSKLAAQHLQKIPFYHPAMTDCARTLYLVCYDISAPARLQKVHKFLQGYKVGGQKSFFECWLTAGELKTVRQQLKNLMNKAEDRIHIFQLDPRQAITTMGCASAVPRSAFMIL